MPIIGEASMKGKNSCRGWVKANTKKSSIFKSVIHWHESAAVRMIA